MLNVLTINEIALEINLPVIRQKDKFHNGGNKKIKLAKFSEKRTFLTPK